MRTSYTDDEAPMTPITAGAAGYVLKEIGSFDRLDTIRRPGAGSPCCLARAGTSAGDRPFAA
jgi:hypothetical protein